MAIILALDYGTKRTGIAVTDPLQIIASGLTTVPTPELLAFVKDFCQKNPVETIVIGAPKQLDNTPSESEIFIQKFEKDLRLALPNIQIERYDERFTSKLATQAMLSGGLKKKKRQNKELIDQISATIILQDYLENRNLRG